MSEMDYLPKNWGRWCRGAGLTVWSTSRGCVAMNWRGHGRHWRINDKGQFQMSEKFKTFDRWANSLAASVDPTFLPHTAKELRALILYMLAGGFPTLKP